MSPPTGYFRREACALRTNIAVGLRVTFARPCPLDAVQASVDQVVWLFMLGLAAAFLATLLLSLPHPRFNMWGLSTHTVDLSFFLFTAYCLGKLLAPPFSMQCFLVLVFASGLWLLLFGSGAFALAAYFGVSGSIPLLGIWGALLVWNTLVVLHILGLLNTAGAWRHAQAFGLYLLIYIFPMLLFIGGPQFWYRAPTKPRHADPWAVYRRIDGEALMYAQPHRLDAVLDRLRPHREGSTDLYFVGFAGYARQNVFRKEVEFTRHLFDTRFNTRGRSLMLINNLKTRHSIPLATATNLKAALKGIGKIMNRKRDVLVLFMTSHGAERPPELDVDFWPLDLDQITPLRLRQDLNAAGIKWRILIVSSCYSGGFVKPLETPYTLIVTAAAADRTSFGCANDRNFTYFGEAFVRDQLSHTYSFIDAYRKAATEIHRRELREHLRASRPQLFVGAAMRPELAALQRTVFGKNR